MTSPNPNDPTRGPEQRPPDAPIYIDPVTHQQLYLDPKTGELRYDPIGNVNPPPDPSPTQGWGQRAPYPGGQYPGAPYPGAPYPGGQYPGAPYPGAPYPGGPYPGGQYPTEQYPGAQYPGAPYPGTPYPYAYGYPPPRTTSGLAIAAFVTAIGGLLLTACLGFGAIPGATGAILGHVARRKIRSTGQGGSGFALAAIIIGWIAAVLGIIVGIGWATTT